MAFADNIPDAANQIASDIAAIDDSLAHLKDCLEAICTGYSDSSTASLEVNDVADATRVDDIKVNEDVSVTATATEINLLDGVTASTAELNTAADGIANPPIAGDSTAGRAIRRIHLTIVDGTNASTIKCTVASKWNGDTIAETDNVAKDATTGNFSLSSDGTQLTIEAAGLTGNCVDVLCINIVANGTETPLFIGGDTIANDVLLYFRDGANNDLSSEDITVLADTGGLYVSIVYLTDA